LLLLLLPAGYALLFAPRSLGWHADMLCCAVLCCAVLVVGVHIEAFDAVAAAD
jgi:hypothetical protein